jgi:ATP-dependent DNA helicase RecQ
MSRVRRGDAKLYFPDRIVRMEKIIPSQGELALIQAIANPLKIVRDGTTWMMQNAQGQALGRMAKSWSPPEGLRFLRGEVGAIVRWRKSDNQEEYRVHLHRDSWEAIIPELVFS